MEKKRKRASFSPTVPVEPPTPKKESSSTRVVDSIRSELKNERPEVSNRGSVEDREEIEKHQKKEVEEEEEQKERVAELFGKTSQSGMPEITVHKSSNTKSLVIWALTMIAIAIGVGGGLVLFTNRNTTSSPVIVETTPTPQ